LLIVVSILLVIAAIAVPSIIAAGEASNESAAVSTMRTIVGAETGYHNLAGAYSAKAAYLGSGGTSSCPNQPDTATPPLGTCLVADAVALQLDAGTLSKYNFIYAQTATGWTLSATPSSNTAGRKAYFVDQGGTITYQNGTTAMTAPSTSMVGQ
jgi:type II secretory pathway pseudopilin PulG